MSDREKLVELLTEACRFNCSGEFCKTWHETCVGGAASHLVANGVTFKKETDA